MSKGDIVLVKFPFTNLGGSKLRPAVIIAEAKLDVLLCFITSQTQWQDSFDIHMLPTSENGLLKESLIRTSKITTIEKPLLKGLLGKLSSDEIALVNQKLKELLELE